MLDKHKHTQAKQTIPATGNHLRRGKDAVLCLPTILSMEKKQNEREKLLTRVKPPMTYACSVPMK